MSKAEKEKIFEIADMVKDIAKLDKLSFESIKSVISNYKIDAEREKQDGEKNV